MRTRRHIGHPARIALGTLLAGTPAVGFALLWAWGPTHPWPVAWAVTLLVVVAWVAGAAWAWEAVLRPLQTLSAVLGALRKGDYAVRASPLPPPDALGEVMRELNAFADLLREQRLGDVETAALLARVMAEVDVALLACDARGVVRLANRAAEGLTGRPHALLVGDTLETLGLAPLLEGPTPRRVTLPGPAAAGGEWELRRSSVYQHGRPHTLLVLSDLRRALREEERQAWQRLVRVLGHEINNSLAPIRSLADNLRVLLARTPRPEDADEDLARGLGVIQRRAAALNRFMAAFTRLARLPPPRAGRVDVAAWVQRVAALETRVQVHVEPGPEVVIDGDADQLDQVAINLLRNAADAALETGGGVRVGWAVQGELLELRVTDDGPGILDPSNLFVPFFTTKADGTGIGLALSRQIVEGHGGAVRLGNRAGAKGCEALVTLPLRSPAEVPRPVVPEVPRPRERDPRQEGGA